MSLRCGITVFANIYKRKVTCICTPHPHLSGNDRLFIYLNVELIRKVLSKKKSQNLQKQITMYNKETYMSKISYNVGCILNSNLVLTYAAYIVASET